MRTALRISLPVAVAALGLTALGMSARAHAEEVIDPYAVRVEPAAPLAPAAPIAPAPTVTTNTTIQQTQTEPPPPPMYQAPPAYRDQPQYPQQAYPPSSYPPPRTFGYQQPYGQPVPVAPPAYQQGYYLYPQGGRAPVYYAPPPAYPVLVPTRRFVPPAKKWDGVRRFSFGLHGSYLGLNQTFDGQRLNMGGAGFQMRIRSKGRFGFEIQQSFLKGQVWNGGFQRSSFPFTASFMGYLMPNDDRRHFNIYALAGFGASTDNITLRNGPYGDSASQDFLSWILQAGGGAELRFKWFAIEADVRALGLFRDNNFGDGKYYHGVNSSAPVANKTLGINANAYMSFWF